MNLKTNKAEVLPVVCNYFKDLCLFMIQGAKEESMLLLRHCYREDELFLDMFDDEYQSMTVRFVAK